MIRFLLLLFIVYARDVLAGPVNGIRPAEASASNLCLVCQYVVHHLQLFNVAVDANTFCDAFSDGELRDKCMKYHQMADLVEPLNPGQFCKDMGTCAHGEEIDITVFTSELSTSDPSALTHHRVVHKGLAMDNKDYLITDEAVQVLSDETTRSLFDQFVAWLRGEPTAQDIFEMYQAQMEAQLAVRLAELQDESVAVTTQEFVLTVTPEEGGYSVMFRYALLLVFAICLVQIPISLWLLCAGDDDEDDEEEGEERQGEGGRLVKDEDLDLEKAMAKRQFQVEQQRRKEMAESFEKEPLVAV